MKYGLTEKQINEIREILASYQEVEQAILFGSRAIDTFKEASDVDIAILGEKCDLLLSAKIKDHLEETYLPFFFDIIAYNTIKSPELKNHIQTKGKVIFQRKEEWKEVRLGEHITTNNKNIDKNYSYNKILYLDTGSITKNQIEKLQEFNLNEAPSRAKRLVDEDDIIYSSVRPNQLHYGYINKPIKNLVVSTGFVVISCYKDRIYPKFLYYYFTLDSSTEHLHSIADASTSAYPSLKPSDIEALLLNLPPLPEQKAIAEVLSSLDDKIDLLHRQNKTLEEMAETLFRQWFIEERDEGWEECTIENLCSRVTSGGTPSTKNDSYYKGKINWYSTKELNDNFLLQSLSKITQEGLDNSSAKLFPRHTVLIAIYASPTVGRLGILTNESTFNQAACGLIADENICCYEFIYLYLKNQRQNLNTIASGSAQQNLNVSKIRAYPAFLPEIGIMNNFREIVRPIFSKIEKSTNQIQSIEKLRDSILPKLMSGEVRITK